MVSSKRGRKMFTKKEFTEKLMDLWIALETSNKNIGDKEKNRIIQKFESDFSWMAKNYYEHDWFNDWANWAVIDTSGAVWEYDSKPVIDGCEHLRFDSDWSRQPEHVMVIVKFRPIYPILINRHINNA
jgi:hypothetical protein